MLSGPTAIAVCDSDPTAAAKVFVDTAKDLPLLVIKGGLVEGNVVGVDEITALSKLPSRQEMMAQFQIYWVLCLSCRLNFYML